MRMRPGLDLLSCPEPRFPPSEIAPRAPAGHLPEERQTGHVLAYGRGKVAPAGRVGRGSEDHLMTGQPLQLSRKPPGMGEREQLVRRAKLLAWLGEGWPGLGAAIAGCAWVVGGVHRARRFRGRLAHRVASRDHPPLAVRRRARLIGECGAERPEAHRLKLLSHSGLRRIRGCAESTL